MKFNDSDRLEVEGVQRKSLKFFLQTDALLVATESLQLYFLGHRFRQQRHPISGLELSLLDIDKSFDHYSLCIFLRILLIQLTNQFKQRAANLFA